MTLAPGAGWRARLARELDRPPAEPRVPLLAQGVRIGSVEPAFMRKLALADGLVGDASDGFRVHGELTASLAAIANAMRKAGLAHTWRDEQLAVRDDAGALLGTIERAAVRPLGIATHAVHLAGFGPDGRHWVQLRSLSKANDPGLWDTLMGGMVPASDSLEDALARETWEEAGLRIAQLEGLAPCGRVLTRRPARDVPHGYIVEAIDCFRCVVPAHTEPRNRDGEVDRFELLPPDEVVRRLLGDEFTLEAQAVLSQVAFADHAQR